MAIDTETKRRSTIALIPPLPVADSLVGPADRAHVCWLYSMAAMELIMIDVALTDALHCGLTASDALQAALTASDALAAGVTITDVSRD